MIQIEVLRAISSEFLRRKLVIIGVIISTVVLVTIVLSVWLISISLWWLIVTIPLFLVCIVTIFLYILSVVLLRIYAPHMSNKQNKEVKRFTDNLEDIADRLQTPIPVIILRIIFENFRHKQMNETFIYTTIQGSTNLKNEFKQLITSFEP